MENGKEQHPASNVALVRERMIGNRITFADIASAYGVQERAVRKLMERLVVPYVRVFGVRYFDPEDVRKALERAEVLKPVVRRRARSSHGVAA